MGVGGVALHTTLHSHPFALGPSSLSHRRRSHRRRSHRRRSHPQVRCASAASGSVPTPSLHTALHSQVRFGGFWIRADPRQAIADDAKYIVTPTVELRLQV